MTFEVDGFTSEDAYFHMRPASEKIVRLRRASGQAPPKGIVRALNCEATPKIVMEG